VSDAEAVIKLIGGTLLCVGTVAAIWYAWEADRDRAKKAPPEQVVPGRKRRAA